MTMKNAPAIIAVYLPVRGKRIQNSMPPAMDATDPIIDNYIHKANMFQQGYGFVSRREDIGSVACH